MIFTITLERPGFLIGKAGITYDTLVKELNTNSKSVELSILETKIWNNIR